GAGSRLSCDGREIVFVRSSPVFFAVSAWDLMFACKSCDADAGVRLAASFDPALSQRARRLPRSSAAARADFRAVRPPDDSSTPMNSTIGTVNPRHMAQKAVRNEAFIVRVGLLIPIAR